MASVSVVANGDCGWCLIRRCQCDPFRVDLHAAYGDTLTNDVAEFGSRRLTAIRHETSVMHLRVTDRTDDRRAAALMLCYYARWLQKAGNE